MEFDKSRIYTSVNADELRAGDKVIVGDDISRLKERVKAGKVLTLKEVYGEAWSYRFGVTYDTTPGVILSFALAYLVERKENCTNCGVKYCSTPLAHKEISVCDRYEPKTEQKANMPELISLGNGQYAERKHTNYNHCEEARKAYDQAMTNACPNKHYRPFKDIDELIEKWWELNGWSKEEAMYKNKLKMPLIWVRYKNVPESKGMLINGFEDNIVYVMYTDRSMQELFDKFEFLDGSPCGVEE